MERRGKEEEIMDSDDTKQIIIAYHAIDNAIDAILKPIRIELNNGETVAKMSNDTYYILHWMKVECESIQKVLARWGDYISAQEKFLDADEELAEAGEMIKDILLDIQPALKIKGIIDFHKMIKTAKAAGL
jgi:negative regulator of genetic competence, sporulation and motility